MKSSQHSSSLMCIILWSPLSRSLSFVCSRLPLRLKDLPLTLPLEMAYLPAVDPIGEMIAWEIHRIISILRYRVPVARRPRISDWGECSDVD
jgi:hypothetical protein